MEEIVKIVDVCKIYSIGNQKKSDNSKNNPDALVHALNGVSESLFCHLKSDSKYHLFPCSKNLFTNLSNYVKIKKALN